MSGHPPLRATALILVAASALLAGVPPAAHAAAGPVSLRYRFTAGEVLTYAMKTVSTSTTAIAGQPTDTDSNTVLFRAHYVVHSVDPAGNATVSIMFDPGKATDVHNGKTTHTTIPADQLASTSSACIQENDGTQYCVYRGGYGLNDVGQVSLAPVSVGGTWTSTIDNTWVNSSKQVSITNKLTGIATDAFGRVANVAATAQIKGTSTYDNAGKHYVMNVHVDESGTWGIGADSGKFVRESLRQSIRGTGTVTDKKGAHAATIGETTTVTMQLISTKQGKAQPLSKAYTTKVFAPSGVHYSLAYPSTWTPSVDSSGSYQIASPNRTSLIIGLSTKNTGNIKSPSFVSSFLRNLGTPLGTIVSTVRTIQGQQYGIADAVLRLTGQAIEAQCEVRVRENGTGTAVVIGIVSLGPPGVNTRPPNLAQEYEQVQQSLDSIQITAAQA